MSSPTHTPRELAQLNVTRLNRAASDLGLTRGGTSLFLLEAFTIPADPEAGLTEDIEVFDVAINWGDSPEDIASLATKFEKLAESLLPSTKGIRRMAEVPGQMQLPGFEG